MRVIGITLCICVGYAYAGGYGSVGLVSGAGSSSTYNGGFGGQSRSNAGTISSGNNVANSFVDNSGSDFDGSSSGSSGLAVNNAAVSSNGGGFYDSSAGSSGGNMAIVVPSGSVDTGVQVMNLNTNNGGVNNIGSQIQFTIQNILRKFGIDMQRNMIRSSSYFQPGQTYVFQTNGMPMDQSQFQDIGTGFQRQSSGMGSMSQSQSQSMGGMGGGAPVSIAYKLISQPTAAVAFQVSSPFQSGSNSFSTGSGFQSGLGSNVLSGARSSSINVPMGNGASGSVSYTGVQPQITVYTPNQNSNAAVVTTNDDSSDDSDSNADASNSYPAPAPVRTYSAPAPVKTYSAPAPVVYKAPAPAPVYVAPAPVYRAPAPVYTPAPVYNSAPAYDAAPVYTASAYSAPVASSYVAPKKSKVKYAASNNHRVESNSNVAYEAESESK